ncbi:MAG: PaaI family thioesterase [Dehalococcoidia bacterium]
MAERPNPARLCFGCGDENPRGLGMRFAVEDGRAVAQFTPPDYLQGYPGRMHGGGVATMLDEAMGWAVYAQGAWAMTARFTMRFHKGIPVGEPLVISGWVTRDRGRFLEVQAEARTDDGTLLAQAEGLFARVTGPQMEELRQIYEGAGRQTETISSLQDGRG